MVNNSTKTSKMQNNNSSKAKTKPNQQRKLGTKKNLKSSVDDISTYALALMDPFNDMAIGAQVPDMYSYPTATYHAEGISVMNVPVVTVAGTLTSGVSSAVFYANPFCSTVSPNLLAISSTGQYSYPNPYVTAAVQLNNMRANLANFRCVGVGLEIRNLLPPTTATGRIIIAPLPVSGLFPGPSALSLSGAGMAVGSAIINVTTGLNAVGGDLPSSILNLPGAQEFTIQDIISNTIKCNFKPCSPDAFNFHSTNDAALLGTGPLAMVQNTGQATAGTTTYTDQFTSIYQGGWDAFIVRIEGVNGQVAQGTATSVPCLEVKYIYHFEGSPAVSPASDISSGVMTAASHHQPLVSPSQHVKVLDVALNRPSLELINKIVGVGKSAYTGYAAGGAVGAMASVMAKIGLQL